MGFRFGKSIKLGGGVRLNVSKKGLGISAGVKGARIGVGPRGVRKTLSIPGTGISYVSESSLSSNKSKRGNNLTQNNQGSVTYPKQAIKGSRWILGVWVGIFTMFAGQLIGTIITLVCGFMFYRIYIKPESKAARLYNKAVTTYSKGNINEALSQLLEAAQNEESNRGINQLLSVIYHDKLKDYQNSLKFAEKLCQCNPGDIIANYIVADSHFELGNYKKAIPVLQSLEVDNQERMQLEKTILLGKCFYEIGQYELAIEQFKKGPVNKRTIDYNVLEFKYWLGITYFKAGDKEKAKRQLAKVYSEDLNYRDIQQYVSELGFFKIN